jgi:hypothetical protein
MNASEFATTYALTTAVGLRPFLTLALASVAMHFGYLHPAAAFVYLGTDGVTWLLAALALLEFAGDKIPVVDHVLQAAHFALKPVAAAILVGSALPAQSQAAGPAYGLMTLGALNALGIHTGITAARGASTLLTLGIANPLLSIIEDVVAAGGATVAILWPFAGAAGAVVVTLIVIVLARYVYLAARAARATASRSRVARSPRRDT